MNSLPKPTGQIINHPDDRIEFVPDEETRERRQLAMLALHEKAARAYAAYGRHDVAAKARAAADRTRAKIAAETKRGQS